MAETPGLSTFAFVARIEREDNDFAVLRVAKRPGALWPDTGPLPPRRWQVVMFIGPKIKGDDAVISVMDPFGHAAFVMCLKAVGQALYEGPVTEERGGDDPGADA